MNLPKAKGPPVVILSVPGVVPVRRPGGFHNAEVLTLAVRIPDCPPEVVPVGFPSFVDHGVTSLAYGSRFRFAFGPAAQLAVITRRLRLFLARNTSTTGGTVADKVDVVN